MRRYRVSWGAIEVEAMTPADAQRKAARQMYSALWNALPAGSYDHRAEVPPCTVVGIDGHTTEFSPSATEALK
jgi:hypothetical protein